MKSSYSGYCVIDGGGLDNSSGKLPCAELFGYLVNYSARLPNPFFERKLSFEVIQLYGYSLSLVSVIYLLFICYLYTFKADLRSPLCQSYLVISFFVKVKKILQFCERLP